MFELAPDFPSELVPLSWLVGSWVGTGVVSYPVNGDDALGRAAEAAGGQGPGDYEFEQHVSFEVESASTLRYEAAVFDRSSGDRVTSERGFWRLLRPLRPFDAGPGVIAGVGKTTFVSAESVEILRRAEGGFDIEAVIAHPDGIAELYVGVVDGPRIDLVTDAVVRPESARDYRAASRMFGLVDGHLLWAWDVAALGEPLRSMASARLARV